MSKSNKQPTGKFEAPSASSQHAPGDGRVPGPADIKRQAQTSKEGAAKYDLIEQLKRDLEKTRLSADLKEQILADLPPPEERERLFRELQDKGGLSSEQFLASLGLDNEPHP
jgi:hypothetical protein